MRYDMFVDKLERLPISYFQIRSRWENCFKNHGIYGNNCLFVSVISTVVEGLFKFVLIYLSMFELNLQFAVVVLFILPLIHTILTYRYYIK